MTTSHASQRESITDDIELLLGILDRNPALTLVGGGANASMPDPSQFSPLLELQR